MSALIVYKDVAVGAKENSTVTASEKQEFVNLNDLKQDIQATNYATLEKDMWLLDGTFEVLPDDAENVGYWSEQLSTETNYDGLYAFSLPVTISRQFNGKYSASGISFEFDVFNNVFCKRINVIWYSGTTILADEVIIPDKPRFYYPINVELFDRIELTFYGLNKPNRYMRMFNVDDGTVRYIGDGYDNEIMSGNVHLNVSIVGDDLQTNSLDFDFVVKGNEKLNFQEKQPIMAYKNNMLLGAFYATDFEQLSANKYSVNADDYVSILEKSKFYGGLYTNEPLKNLIAKIFENENIEYYLDEKLENISINGYLPICNKREALRQIAIATGAVMTLANSTIFQILSNVENEPKIIDKTRIKTGGKIINNSKYTGVKLITHDYSGYADLGQQNVFEGIITGTAIIEFDKIYDNVHFGSGTGPTAEIKEVSVNHAIVSANGENVKLIASGVLGDTTRIHEKNNAEILANATKNIVEINNATLITEENATETINRLYEYFLKNKKIQAEFVATNENIGENVTLQNEFSGEQTGKIINSDISLGGNKLFMNCEVLIDG